MWGWEWACPWAWPASASLMAVAEEGRPLQFPMFLSTVGRCMRNEITETLSV